jgi:hypothetical protein
MQESSSNAIAAVGFELISRERVLFSGEARGQRKNVVTSARGRPGNSRITEDAGDVS